MELDNIKTVDLPILLNKDTTLARFYPLIPAKHALVDRLLGAGIVDAESMRAQTRLDDFEFALVARLFKLHAFIPRKLAEATSVSRDFIDALISDGVKTSYDYITLCADDSAADISRKYGAPEGDARRLYGLCDLMRLPGVKYIRADLYFDCGYKSLNDFANADAHKTRAAIAEYIVKHHIPKSVPLLKELSTQIAVAKVLPKIEPLS